MNVYYVPFTQYSHFPTNLNDQQSPKQRKNIIVGGYYSNDDGFYEFDVDDVGTSINHKSFKNDYDKIFANLKCIGLKNAKDTNSYLVQNNKYIVVFGGIDEYYNVYDIENDKWLLTKGKKTLRHHLNRSVLINDEIIIGSSNEKLYFYFIGKDHITNPILIHVYMLNANGILFYKHGMCVIDFVQQESPKDKSYQTYKLKIVLFGGLRRKDFLSSFLCLDIVISYISNDKKFKLVSLAIDDNLIDKKKIKLINMNENTIDYYFSFGFECIVNSKNEPVIIIIGGNDSRCIHLFNCVTYELTRHQEVSQIHCV